MQGLEVVVLKGVPFLSLFLTVQGLHDCLHAALVHDAQQPDHARVSFVALAS